MDKTKKRKESNRLTEQIYYFNKWFKNAKEIEIEVSTYGTTLLLQIDNIRFFFSRSDDAEKNIYEGYEIVEDFEDGKSREQ